MLPDSYRTTYQLLKRLRGTGIKCQREGESLPQSHRLGTVSVLT
jgi:hypothetical protein